MEKLFFPLATELRLQMRPWCQPTALLGDSGLGMMITTCMSCLTTGGPNKEHGAATKN